MATIEEKIKALQEKLKQEKAKKQKMEARKKAAETKVVRATDTRKKILLGAYMMEVMEKNPESTAKFMTGLDAYLKRDDDRSLFGFCTISKMTFDLDDEFFLVRCFDKDGVLIESKVVQDRVCADGWACGMHSQFACDAWVGDVQIFSHLQHNVRLVPGVVDSMGYRASPMPIGM